MKDRATAIAEKHMQKTNPSHWDGTGPRPDDFDHRIGTYPIDEKTELDISFEPETKNKWFYICELRDRESGELLDVSSCDGIESADKIAATIRELCGNRL